MTFFFKLMYHITLDMLHINVENKNHLSERDISSIECDTVVNVRDVFFEGCERLLFYAGFT